MVNFTPAEEARSVDRGLQSFEINEIEKLKLQGNITLNDFVFNTIDEYGVVWVITDIENWWNTPEADVPSMERGDGDGGYEMQGRYTSREIAIQGVFLTTDPTLVEAARDRLIQAMNLAYTGAWLKTGSEPIRASYVQLIGAVETNTVNTRGRTEFSIPLRAVDPIKYHWNDEAPDGYFLKEGVVKNLDAGYDGLVTVENIGNYPVPVYFEITGPFTGPGFIFNKTTNELILLTQGLKGRISRSVVNKQLAFDVEQLKDIATLTTTIPHGFSVGDSVFVSGTGTGFDGDQLITSVPTRTTFTFDADAADIRAVAQKTLTSGVATLQTVLPHGYSTGDEIIVNGVDATFDGTYEITGTPTANKFTYDRIRSTSQNIATTILTANIATITTENAHEFILGEEVTISGAGVNYDGTYEISDIPNETSFSYAATRTNSRDIVNKSMTEDVVTITTSAEHGFVVNEGVNVRNVDLSLNGGYFIKEIPSSTTFTYDRVRATQRSVIVKAVFGNVATVTTSQPHGFNVGEEVRLQNIDSDFNGIHTITDLPSNTTFTFSLVRDDLVSTSVSNGTAHLRSRQIRNISRSGNVVAVVTEGTHGAIFGEEVTINSGKADFDGTYQISGIPSLNVFLYEKVGANVDQVFAFPIENFSRSSNTLTINTSVAHDLQAGQDILVKGLGEDYDGSYTVQTRTNTRVTVTRSGTNFGETDAPDGATIIYDFKFADLSGTIPSTSVTDGTATVGGSLPLTSSQGVSSVSENIVQQTSGGNAIKTNDVQFTPGLSGATAVVDSDILEIDTKKREVAFNGVVPGARGRVDVLADFIRLAPGENEIEFEDTGNPESESSIKIFYRSGWLS